MTIFNIRKRQELAEINNKLLPNIERSNNIIFIYTKPKVGSTSLVSSIRLFASNKFSVLHLHDEEMLKVICNLSPNSNITINDIIQYNKSIGKNVYVIDVYRSPIERKISAFFEKIGAYHFNNIDSKINTYDIERVIKRFNTIFPHIANGDNFLDCYNLTNKPLKFDTNNKYLYLEENGIKYIKLRLCDSSQWSYILTKLLQTEIIIVKDYESTNKEIKDLYIRFKNEYKIPINFINEYIQNDTYLNYYYSEVEKQQYINEWLQNSTPNIYTPFTKEEYKLYEEITIENCHLDYIQQNHYLDEGCICNSCNTKRTKVCEQIKQNQQTLNQVCKVWHEEASVEMAKKRLEQAVKVTRALSKMPNKYVKGRKDFNGEMKSVVKMGK